MQFILNYFFIADIDSLLSKSLSEVYIVTLSRKIGSHLFVSFFLQRIGRNLYTVSEVVSEVRDKATRARLQVLPYELKIRDPQPEYYQHGLYIFGAFPSPFCSSILVDTCSSFCIPPATLLIVAQHPSLLEVVKVLIIFVNTS